MSRLSTAPRRRPPAGRRGTILVVVLALLAIFAVIGISFVFYSDGEALAARYNREAMTRSGVGLPPVPNFDREAETVFGKLIFGDYDSNPLNSFRGHDLMSAIYGGQGKSTDPYTGQGIFHQKMGAPFDTIPSRGHVIHYTPLPVGTNAGGQQQYYAFDPEITGPPRSPANPGDPLPPIPTDMAALGSGKTYVSKAAPYTYPDLNNFYLASVCPATGEVLVPSFFRAWHFNGTPVGLGGGPAPAAAPPARRLEAWNPLDGVLVANTDWVIPEGRARTLRPRPIDQLVKADFDEKGLPYPLQPRLANYSAAQLKPLYDLIEDRIRTGRIIGYPRPNALRPDVPLPYTGTPDVTGDIANLLGGIGPQRNDSILVDYGVAPFEWPAGSGRFVKPLAAVLITDLDGSLNPNVHGNTRDAGNHISHHGLGPWEVNLAGAIGNVPEGNGIVSGRYGSYGQPGARNGTTSLAFDPSGVRLNTNSLVNWDGTGKASGITPPGFAAKNPFTVTPSYGPGGFYDDNTSTTQPTNHPALFNPGDWPAYQVGKSLSPLPPQPPGTVPGGGTYPIADTRRLRQQYAATADLYQPMTINKIPVPATNALVGNGVTYPSGKAAYRYDPAHSRRLMITTLSADLDRPRLMGNATSDGATPSIPGGVHPFNKAFTGTLNAGSAATILPALDLHRQLADYRSDTSKGLSPSNASNADKAWADRHNLARDVFARLVVATGADKVAGVTVDPASGDVKLPAPVVNGEYDALRYLAQLAANIVDYIDNDDVSTVFVWNPSANDLQVVDATTVVSTATTDLAANAGERVVFGVEKPRLVLNEAYAEVTNDASEASLATGTPPTKNAQVRFWVELLNPSGDATKGTYLGGADGPLAGPPMGTPDGSVALYVGATHRPYRLQVGKGADEETQLWKTPGNVAGDLTTALVDFRFDSADITATAAKQTVAPNDGKYDGSKGVVVVGPKVTAFHTAEMKSDPAAAPWNGATYIQSEAISATATTGSNAMGYALPLPTAGALESFAADGSKLGRQTIVLRRLANPYLPEGVTNPYVTVDVMDFVPAHDAVHRGSGDTNDRAGQAMTPGAGYVPLNNRFSVGKVQPYAGFSASGVAPGAQPKPDDFPKSFVVPQVDGSVTALPKNSFFRHNGKSSTAPAGPNSTVTPAVPPDAMTMTPGKAPTLSGETIVAPFEWYFHPDRPLLNEMELLHVQAVKPHEMTRYTFHPPVNDGEPVRQNLGFAPWFGVTTAAGATQGLPPYDPNVASGLPAFQTDGSNLHKNETGLGLYRAFELLRGKSRMYGTATGGRVQGKINLNTVQDARVLVALLDPQPASAFKTADVFDAANLTSTDTIWGRFIQSRTHNISTNAKGPYQRFLADGTTLVATTFPGKTVDDDPYDPNWQTLDRPFKAFGVAEAGLPANYATAYDPDPTMNQVIVGGGNSVATDGAMPTPNPTTFGPGIQDTILRVNADPKLPNDRAPLIFHRPEKYGPKDPATVLHPYLQAEPLRKMMNNVTTVSNVFAVHVTIVFHNVRMNPAAVPPAPLFESIPGIPQPRAFIGAEAFREVPGDLRQQYFAIVDRSNAAVTDPNANTVLTNPFQAATATALGLNNGTGSFTLANAVCDTMNNTVSIASDGQVVTLSATGAPGTVNSIYVGSGGDRVKLDITQITIDTMPTPPVATFTVKQPAMGTTTRTFPAGSVVSNGVPGRPTYPTGFSPLSSNHPYQLLVPYCSRVR